MCMPERAPEPASSAATTQNMYIHMKTLAKWQLLLDACVCVCVPGEWLCACILPSEILPPPHHLNIDCYRSFLIIIKFSRLSVDCLSIFSSLFLRERQIRRRSSQVRYKQQC